MSSTPETVRRPSRVLLRAVRTELPFGYPASAPKPKLNAKGWYPVPPRYCRADTSGWKITVDKADRAKTFDLKMSD